ncbi:zinc-ribbon domain-containing protein [Gemmatimonas sp.]|uniref:zinc-ribbon domain-containing protein n=1 Tax=Gemmatimonas sp. TaxID=1962908 RepID=UPI0027BAE1E5|nr:zinc-ribbon domain-containing protein [Gemmatimonas sp.]
MTPPNSTAGAGFCAACGAALSAGARFCHRCGTPLGQGLPVARQAQPASGAAAVLPWGVAFVALLALIAMVAGKNFGKPAGSSLDGSANSLPTQELDGQGAGAAPFAGGAGGGAAPNIANLSPSERANKLYIRIMEYAEMGKVDSVAFFAPMAMASHEMLESPSLDERYHFGRIAEVTGNAEVAKAQADIILTEQADNLLGLLLAARAARMTKDDSAARGFDARLLKALAPQLATQAEEYVQHRSEIDRAVSDAQKR